MQPTPELCSVLCLLVTRQQKPRHTGRRRARLGQWPRGRTTGGRVRKMSTVEEECPACIPEFLNNNKAAVDYLRSLNVLPKLVKCPMCMKDCSLREDQQIWRCRQSYQVPKTKKRRPCVFSVSDYRDTFLHHVNLPPWKVVLFVSHWLRRVWAPARVTKCLRSVVPNVPLLHRSHFSRPKSLITF